VALGSQGFSKFVWGLPSPERERDAPPGRGPISASRLRWVKGLKPAFFSSIIGSLLGGSRCVGLAASSILGSCWQMLVC
jgi:hypothetical protein